MHDPWLGCFPESTWCSICLMGLVVVGMFLRISLQIGITRPITVSFSILRRQCWMARRAETYTEVVMRSKTMVEFIAFGMADDVRTQAYDILFDRTWMGRWHCIFSVHANCAGSEDFFRIWSLMEAEAY